MFGKAACRSAEFQVRLVTTPDARTRRVNRLGRDRGSIALHIHVSLRFPVGA